MSALNHWMLHDNVLAREFQRTLAFSPNYAPVRRVDSGMTFFCPMTGVSLFAVQGYVAGQAQNSAKTLRRREIMGELSRTSPDYPRCEYEHMHAQGCLVEPPITNKTRIYSANPDAALTGYSIVAGNGALVRASMPEHLKAAGLADVCDSGYTVAIDARGASATDIAIEGLTDTAYEHTVSAWIYCPQGSGHLSCENAADVVSFEENDGFDRIAGKVAPSLSGRMTIRADADALVYVTLAQLEQLPVVSSPIENTTAVPTSRDRDYIFFSWADVHGSNIIDSQEGMAAYEFRLADDFSAAINDQGWRANFMGTPTGEFFGILAPVISANPVRARGYYIINAEGQRSWIEVYPPAIPQGVSIIAYRWKRPNIWLGYRHGADNIWYWSDPKNDFYDFGDIYAPAGGFHFEANAMSWHVLNLRIWDEERGASWLEEFYANVI